MDNIYLVKMIKLPSETGLLSRIYVLRLKYTIKGILACYVFIHFI